MRNRALTIFVVLLLAAVLLVAFSLQGITKPAESIGQQTPRPFTVIISGVGDGFKSFFKYFGSVKNLSKKNAELVEEVRNLQQQNVTLEQYKVENEKLKQELAYRNNAPFELISAKAIASDPTGFSQMIIINAGTNSGVKVGSAVLAQGVLVGKVSSVDSFTAKVLLITDPQSTVQAQISGTSDNGIVRGSYGSGIVIEMVSQNTQINKGDRVITAGLNPEIPQGILIGTIGEVQSQKNDLLQKSSVISGVDLKNLNFLAVIKQ